MRKSVLQNLIKEAEGKYEGWEQSEGLSEETKDRLLSMVREEEAKKESRSAEKTMVSSMSPKYLVPLAAGLILLSGMSVMGDKSWWMRGTDGEIKGELTTKIENAGKDTIMEEENAMYQEIAEQLGISPMMFGYVPDGMVLDSYAISPDTGWAFVNYMYQGTCISVQMSKGLTESLSNVRWDGEVREIDIEFETPGYEVNAYCVDVEHGNYGASIYYAGGYYCILGRFESEKDFLMLLREIYFESL